MKAVADALEVARSHLHEKVRRLARSIVACCASRTTGTSCR